MNPFKVVAHSLIYATWLSGQVIKESVVMMIDTFGTGRRIAPVVCYYPLRITKERDIAALTASITMTPGTLALGVTGPKEVDFDARNGDRTISNAFLVGPREQKIVGTDSTQRYLAVHAMYGQDPLDLLEGFADMEARLAPSIAHIKQEFDVDALVERGRPGPRGYRGSRGGRASDETIFDVEKVDSTPHAAAYVAAVMSEEDSDDLSDAQRNDEFGFRDPLYPNRHKKSKKTKKTKSKPKNGPKQKNEGK